MKKLLIVLAVLSSACSTVRTRSSDPVMRVTIDADSMSPSSYVRLQKAVFSSGKFVVVDRAAGFRAVAKEQEIQHTTSRFGANEKYALWGKMFGVGGIFVGAEQCKPVYGIWSKPYATCTQNLSLINATTGEVMAVSEVNEDSDGPIEPSWGKAVYALIDEYPRVFIDKHNPHQTVKYDSALEEYREKTVIENVKPSKKMESEDFISNR